MGDLVTIERQGRVAIVRFDTGTRANALSQALIRELTDAARQFHDAPDVSAVVLTGRADQFTLGADLKDPERAASADAGLSERRILLRAGPRLCQAWEDVDALTICAIEGWCVGGGMALAAACDLRVASREAMLYVPEVERGMNMSWGSIPRFVALVGPARTKRLAALCEKVPAQTAYDWGLCDHLTEPGGALRHALEVAERASGLPPTALKMVKQDVNVAAHALARATAHRDLEAFLLTQESEDFREGVAAFLEGRKPDYSGN
ncbi:enoyl-CoA hydratase/isomerase family protein [Henriciella mobilis]|uniref:enoyl-CoA hydratase/isomerase family protein n=1 Tax=Henriciella mobilis TaxID=2305467 RepID=UPI000E6724AA|nr:enoyl-CoA hydratase/isomerase family protein [Henriciella mobilis]RIJ17781.1 enoyl-CoA hydratase/isomerase family protein [Henriciella mobilis]RIJ25406.1 enoyl-CoA hydratase/isomerase family protein [Henriciella mobilis]